MPEEFSVVAVREPRQFRHQRAAGRGERKFLVTPIFRDRYACSNALAESRSASLEIAPRVMPSRSASALGTVDVLLVKFTQHHPLRHGYLARRDFQAEGMRDLIGHVAEPVAEVVFQIANSN